MFKHPFSFAGRIRRTEYGLSYIFFIIILISLYLINFFLIIPSIIIYSISYYYIDVIIFYSLLFFLYWFLFAQGAKRCHDLGRNGWWQIIPVYGFIICLFQGGEDRPNEYGEDPKASRNRQMPDYSYVNQNVPSYNQQQVKHNTDYPGGYYDGGHNKPQNARNAPNSGYYIQHDQGMEDEPPPPPPRRNPPKRDDYQRNDNGSTDVPPPPPRRNPPSRGGYERSDLGEYQSGDLYK